MDNYNAKLRIVDRWGHTLFYFNCETGSIEIKSTTRRGGEQGTKGELYAINIGQLMSTSQENLNSDEPVFIFVANKIMQKE